MSERASKVTFKRRLRETIVKEKDLLISLLNDFLFRQLFKNAIRYIVLAKNDRN